MEVLDRVRKVMGLLYRKDGYEEEEEKREGDDGDDGKMKRNFLARRAWATRAGGALYSDAPEVCWRVRAGSVWQWVLRSSPAPIEAEGKLPPEPQKLQLPPVSLMFGTTSAFDRWSTT
jgi:hypothetical protein